MGSHSICPFALAGVAQWIECWPANRGITHAWVAGQVPQCGECKRQPHIAVSLPLFLSSFPSLKINKIFKKQLEKQYLSFCGWLNLLHLMSSRFIHILACVRISSLVPM